VNETPSGQCDEGQNNKPFLPRGGLYIVLAGLGLGAALWWLSRAFGVTTEKYTFWMQGGANALIFLAILGQVLIYRRQWDVMERQWKQTQCGIKSAEESAIDANRAYVLAKIKDTSPYDEGFQFRLIIENGGNTPANNVCVHYWCDFGDPPWPVLLVEETPPNTAIKQVVFETTKAGTTERLGVIGPKGSQVFTTIMLRPDMSLGSEASKQFDSGQSRFYCWGTILYEDMFKKTRQSHFCFCQWRKTEGGYLSFEQLGTGYPCEHGNYVT
jgi:hypothetical protein